MMSFNKETFSVRFMKALRKKLKSKAKAERIYISDILEAGAIAVLDKSRVEIIKSIEDFKATGGK